MVGKSACSYLKGPLITVFQTDLPYGWIIQFTKHIMKMTRRLPVLVIYS